jgi:hypothetical protein
MGQVIIMLGDEHMAMLDALCGGIGNRRPYATQLMQTVLEEIFVEEGMAPCLPEDRGHE